MSETEKTEEREKKKISSKANTPAQAGGEAQKHSSPSKKIPSAAAKAAAPVAAKPVAPKEIRIRQIKSGICAPVDQKQTLLGLGLRCIRHEVVRPDTPTVRGQVHKVRHLVEIVERGAAR